MTAITLFEHETSSVGCTAQDLRALEGLDRASGVSMLRTAVRDGKIVLQATQHVGVVRLGQRTIQVLPKIYSHHAQTDRRAHEATRNVLAMFAYAGELRVHERGLAALAHQHADWFEILTNLFATHLQDEWQRGPYRSYREIDADLPMLKGRLRIAVALRRPERRHRFAVTHDEFTVDNPLNRIFRFVVERLWSATKDPENKRRLTHIRILMDEVTLVPALGITETAAVALNRTSSRFEPLLNLARLFLARLTLQLTAGTVQTFAFMLDMNALFEAFLIGFIQRHRDAILPACWAHCSLLPQTRGTIHHLARAGTHPVFRLKPDMALRVGDGFPLLLDAKYKRLDAADRRLGVAQGDFYQMYAYARRYNCPRVLLIYPQTAEMGGPLRRRFNLELDLGAVDVATLDLQVDLTSPNGRASLVSRLKELMAMGELSDAS